MRNVGDIKNCTVAVAGTGYVGLTYAALLSNRNRVIAVDILPERVEMINSGKSPIHDPDLEVACANIGGSEGFGSHLKATVNAVYAYSNADVVVIAVPTNYDEDKDFFDTHHIEDVLDEVFALNPDALVVIKSTIPIGYTERMRCRYGNRSILFSPEFLREGSSLADCLHPDRVIVGHAPEADGEARFFASLLDYNAGYGDSVRLMYMGTSEAEAVKLFSNGYLAARVAFFNELDGYALHCGLDTWQIIRGVTADSRIGSHYCNPSFGYGGYCFPKDTKQLAANFHRVGVDAPIADAIVRSNAERKRDIAGLVASRASVTKCVGVYRLAMKSGSDNYRMSAVTDIVGDLIQRGYDNMIVYEPLLPDGSTWRGCKVVNNLESFLASSDIILANRMSSDLIHARGVIISRDIYSRDI